MSHKVRCRYCGTKTEIPTCRPDRKLQTTLAYLATKNWVFFGCGEGSCPDCTLVPEKMEVVAI